MHIRVFPVLFLLLSIAAQVVALGVPGYIFSADRAQLVVSGVFAMLLFLLADIINERRGLRATLVTVIGGVFLQGLIALTALAAGRQLPSMLITLALVGIFVGETLDAMLFAYLKKKTGEHYLWLRTFLSTVVAVVFEGAFLFVGFPFMQLIAPQLIAKFVFSLLNIPLIYALHHSLLRPAPKE